MDTLEGKREILKSLLSSYCPVDGSILIAGCADESLLALVAGATEGLNASITVLDQCPAPLSICQDYANRRGLAVRTEAADLSRTMPGGPYDVILADLLLTFIPRDYHGAFFHAVAEALKDDGHLIIAHRPIKAVRRNQADGQARIFAAQTIELLASRDVLLPEEESEFRLRLEREYMARRARDSNSVSCETVEKHFAGAGLKIRQKICSRRLRNAPADSAQADGALATFIFLASRGTVGQPPAQANGARGGTR